MKSQRVVVPQALRAAITQGTPWGICHKEKSTEEKARDTVYWPAMAKDIDATVASRKLCNRTKPHQQKEKMLIHPVPDLPWSAVSADLFDWNGIQYLVLVDSYSGWFEMDTLHLET